MAYKRVKTRGNRVDGREPIGCAKPTTLTTAFRSYTGYMKKPDVEERYKFAD